MKHLYMKVLLTLAVCLGVMNSGYGQQTLPFTEDFSGGVIPADWAVFHGQNGLGNAGKNWLVSIGAAYAQKENSTGGGGGDNLIHKWMVTPLLDLNSENNILRFNEWNSSGTTGTIYTIKVSTGSQTNHGDFVTLATYNATDITATPTLRELDLSIYNGNDVYVAFVHSQDNDGNWYVDDIEVTGSNVAEAANFQVTGIQTDQLDLSWQQNASTDSVLLVYDATGTFGDPVEGTSYAVDDVLSGGGQVLFHGDATTYSHTGLSEFSPYYYKLWSFDTSHNYSLNGVEANAITLGNLSILFEDFEGGSGITWNTTPASPSNGDDAWSVEGNKTAYRGSQAAYIDEFGNAGDLAYDQFGAHNCTLSTTVDMSTGGYISVDFSFFWKCLGVSSLDYGELWIEGVRVSEVGEFVSQSQWREYSMDLSSYIGNAAVDIEFRWNNTTDASNLYNAPGFCIDDVRITGSTVESPSNFAGVIGGASRIDLSWLLNGAGDDVLITYSRNFSVGRPINNNTYEVGDFLPGGGEIIYKGTSSPFVHSHSDLESGTHYYRIWSVNDANIYSASQSLKISLPLGLPVKESFESQVDAWVYGSDNQNSVWYHGRGAGAQEGSFAAYVSSDGGFTPGYDVSNASSSELKVPVNLEGYNTSYLSFYYKVQGDTGNDYGDVSIDGAQIAGPYTAQGTWTKVGPIDISSYNTGIRDLEFRWVDDGNGSGTNPAFCIDSITIVGSLDPVATFSADNYNTTYNRLSWTRNAAANDVLIAFSTLGFADIGAPVTTVDYIEGDVLPGGGTVIYKGTGTSYDHSLLNANTTYYYKVFSQNNTIYSSSLQDNATTLNNVVFFEDFESGVNGWATTSGNNDWYVGTAVTGLIFDANSAYVSNDLGATASHTDADTETVTIYKDFDLTGLSSANLTFYYQIGGNAGDTYGEVIVNDGVDNELVTNLNGQVAPASLDYSLNSYVGGVVTVKFVFVVTKTKGGADPSFCIDNMAIYGDYDQTSTFADGAGTPAATISSLVDTEAEAQMVMDVIFTDAGSGDAKDTYIHKLTFNQAGDNQIVDWQDAISGAVLYGPDLGESSGTQLSGTVNGSTIVFEQEDMVIVGDGTSETYQLKIWLNQSLSSSLDNQRMAFSLDVDDVVSFKGSAFDLATASISTTTGQNQVTIDATELRYGLEPSEYGSTGTVLSEQPILNATDANGNIDSDYATAVSLTSSAGLGLSYTPVATSNGVATFTDVQFSTAGGPTTLTASSGALTDAVSREITISNYPGVANVTGSPYLSLVNFNAIDNYSVAGTHELYIDQSTNVTKNVAYTLTVVINTGGPAGFCKAWVDWDQSNTFEIGEEVDLGSASGDGQVLATSVTVPAGALLGATRLRVVVSSDATLSSTDTKGTGEAEDYTVVITNNEWKGASPVWDATTNWTSGAVPTAVTDVFIPEAPSAGSYFPIIDGSVTVNDVDIEANARLTVNPGSQLSIDGDLHNDGLFILQYNVDNISSFINNGSITGTGQARIDFHFSSSRWWYLGHALDGASSADYNAADQSVVRVYSYNNDWQQIADNATSFTTPLDGYSVNFKDATTVQHTGDLRVSNYSTSGLTSGWHLMANPYPAYADLDLENSNPGVDWTFTNVPKFVYTRTTIGALRVAIVYDIATPGNSHIEATQYLAPMQAFWITSSGSGTFGVNNSAVAHDPAGGKFKSATIAPEDILKFTLGNQYSYDYAAISFSADGSDVKTANDASKFFESSTKFPHLYSRKGNDAVAINVLPEVSENTTIPLYHKMGADGSGELTLTAINISDFNQEIEVWLEDLVTGDWVDLRESPVYTYSSSEVVEENRFMIHMSRVSTHTNNVDKTKPNGFNVFANQNIAVVELNNSICLPGGSRTVRVYTISGEKMVEKSMNERHIKITLPAHTAYYIVEVEAEGELYHRKIMISAR